MGMQRDHGVYVFFMRGWKGSTIVDLEIEVFVEAINRAPFK